MSQPHDVLVVLSHERKYPLHANALARNSVFFANILTEPNAAKLSNKAKAAGIKTRWQVELVEMESDRYPAGRLELIVSNGQISLELRNFANGAFQRLNAKGERADGFSGLVLNENGRVPSKLFDCWERVLYSFYRSNIRIDNKDMIAALADCDGLIRVAEYLGCVSLIGEFINPFAALQSHYDISEAQDIFQYVNPFATSVTEHQSQANMSKLLSSNMAKFYSVRSRISHTPGLTCHSASIRRSSSEKPSFISLATGIDGAITGHVFNRCARSRQLRRWR